jgi:hypothetical protein
MLRRNKICINKSITTQADRIKIMKYGRTITTVSRAAHITTLSLLMLVGYGFIFSVL